MVILIIYQSHSDHSDGDSDSDSDSDGIWDSRRTVRCYMTMTSSRVD